MIPFYKSKTPKELRDFWETPPDFMAWAVPRWNLQVDAACNIHNMKLPVGLTDSLNLDWASFAMPGTGVFCNPPFSKLPSEPWVEKFIETAENGRRMVALTNNSSGAYWWHDAAAACTELWLSRGRMGFIDPQTGKPVDGNNLPQSVFVFEPGRLGERKLMTFDVIDYSIAPFGRAKYAKPDSTN